MELVEDIGNIAQMTIKFVLMVNKQGQTRVARYTDPSMSSEERLLLEAEIVRRCLTRLEKQCNFIEHRGVKVVYRRYASLFFLVGVDEEENELSILELIHCLVETLDKWFGNVCELDIMYNLETVRSAEDRLSISMWIDGCLVYVLSLFCCWYFFL